MDLMNYENRNVRYFCYGEQIGVVEKSIFYPVHFDRIKFLKIVLALVKGKKRYNSIDWLLKEAISEYVGVKSLHRQPINNASIYDSKFYDHYFHLLDNNAKCKAKIKKDGVELREMNEQKLQEQKRNRLADDYQVENILKIALIKWKHTVRR